MLETSSDILDVLETPVLRRLYRYWDGKRGERGFPARRDIDPVEFSYALGQVMLLDVLYAPQRFRFRVHGTILSLRAGYEMTGRMADDLPGPENRAHLIQRCGHVVATKLPIAIRGDRVIDGRRRRYEALWMPLGPDVETIDMIFGGMVYLDP